jgi:hypothetical protein
MALRRSDHAHAVNASSLLRSPLRPRTVFCPSSPAGGARSGSGCWCEALTLDAGTDGRAGKLTWENEPQHKHAISSWRLGGAIRWPQQVRVEC